MNTSKAKEVRVWIVMGFGLYVLYLFLSGSCGGPTHSAGPCDNTSPFDGSYLPCQDRGY